MGKQAASSSCFLGITILQQDYNYNHMKPHISWGKHLVSTRQLPGQTQWLSVSCGIDCLWVYDSLWVIFWLGLNPISYQYPINILSISYQYPINILSISSYQYHPINIILSISYQYPINILSISYQYPINILSISYQYPINIILSISSYQYPINILSISSYQYPINILSISYQDPINILSISYQYPHISSKKTQEKQTTGPGPPQLLESVTQPSAPSSWARAWMRSMPWSHTGKFVDSVDPTFFSTCYNWRAHWSSAMLGCLEWQPHCVWCVWFRMIY